MAEAPEPRKVTVQPPYPLAIVVCDAIHQDPGTGKRTVLGCFSTIFAREFPVVHPAMALYVALTDGHGKVPIKLRLIDVEEQGDALIEAEGEVIFPDPRAVLEMDFHLSGVVFPRAGEYRFQLFAGTEALIERRIVVLKGGEEKGEAG